MPVDLSSDLTGHNGFMAPEEGAKLPAKYALLGEGVFSGQFVAPSGETSW